MTKNSASRSESRQPATISSGMAILMGLALVVVAVLITVAVVFAFELGPQGPSQARNAKDAMNDSAQRAMALAKEQERQAQALRDARQQESLEEQAAVFRHARTFSICSPDGVAYWSYAAKWDSRSRTLAPRYDQSGHIVRCEFETNIIIPRLAPK